MSRLLLAIDQGTTSTRAIVFSPEGEIVRLEQKELGLVYPQKGWVEQSAEGIWQDTLDVVRHVIADDVAVIGIANQRETTIVWDRGTGRPIYNAIVWQDRRTWELCERLKKQGVEEEVAGKTGLLIDPYFSATKIAWILENVDGARAKAEAGELAFGTVDSWLLWNLTGGEVHATDATNAARTMLFNIRTQQWDTSLLALFGIPASMLPEVRDNVAHFGDTREGLLGQRYPIGGMAGDQQAALVGQACFEAGMVKSTYGTGCFALINIGAQFKRSKERLLTTIAYRINGETTYAIEGSIFVAGAAIQWLRDNLGLIGSAAESESLARSVEDNSGVYFVPAFTGLGAPYWEPSATAMITGLSRDSTAAHIVRAALEAQAFQTRDLMAAMESDSGFALSTIRADGGLVTNGFLCQFLADMLDRPVEIPGTSETTAWGAACLAGLYAGIFTDLDAVRDRWQARERYAPRMDTAERDALYAGWQKAVRQVLA